jgi:hypothetical protein
MKTTLFAVACSIALLGATRPDFLPKDATESAACVPALGDVYWNPAKLPFGPTYGVFKGKPIFEEFMVPKDEFAKGRNWKDITIARSGLPVDHVDIWFAPHGHDGAPMPHYDVILFFVPHAEHMRICNPSGKLPDFVLPE